MLAYIKKGENQITITLSKVSETKIFDFKIF
jgi:hypothetical protein